MGVFLIKSVVVVYALCLNLNNESGLLMILLARLLILIVGGLCLSIIY